MSTIPAYLPTIFSDPRVRRYGRYIHYIEAEGKKIGAVAATNSPGRDNFLLNKAEFERARDGLRTGKVDLAFVVAAKLNGGSTPPEYQGADQIEAVALRLANGRFGDFWALSLDDDAARPL